MGIPLSFTAKLVFITSIQLNSVQLLFHTDSVTRFGNFLPLWPNFKSLGQIFEGYFSILQNVNLTLAKMLYYLASFYFSR